MSISVTGFPDLEKALRKSEKANELAKKAVDKASPILEESLRAKISTVTTRGYSTGTLAASISSTKAKVNDRGVFAAVRPTGRDSKGVRNAEKLAYLEYGTSRQAARPVRGAATAAVEGECVSVIEKVICAELGAEP